MSHSLHPSKPLDRPPSKTRVVFYRFLGDWCTADERLMQQAMDEANSVMQMRNAVLLLLGLGTVSLIAIWLPGTYFGPTGDAVGMFTAGLLLLSAVAFFIYRSAQIADRFRNQTPRT